MQMIRRALARLIMPRRMRQEQRDLQYRLTSAEATLRSLEKDRRAMVTFGHPVQLQARVLELENTLRHIDNWRHNAKVVVPDAYLGALDLYALKRIIMEALYDKVPVQCPECDKLQNTIDEMRTDLEIVRQPFLVYGVRPAAEDCADDVFLTTDAATAYLEGCGNGKGTISSMEVTEQGLRHIATIPIAAPGELPIYVRSRTGTFHRADVADSDSNGPFKAQTWCGLKFYAKDLRCGKRSDIDANPLCGNCARLEKART